jgi:hypothetical protein
LGQPVPTLINLPGVQQALAEKILSVRDPEFSGFSPHFVVLRPVGAKLRRIGFPQFVRNAEQGLGFDLLTDVTSGLQFGISCLVLRPSSRLSR